MKLTTHQAEVLARLKRLSGRYGNGWVAVRYIGSRGALEKLVEKGWAQVDVRRGPRGGEHRYYRPTVRDVA